MQDEEYRARQRLLKEAFTKSADKGKLPIAVSLDVLVSLMKTESTAKGHLSSLYFAGSEGDHPYFLLNDKFAAGISVLPEDEAKTSQSKRHPNQREIVVVLKGALRLDVDGNWKSLREGAVEVIEKNQCHRILSVDKTDAVFLFVKTNPAEEPRGEECRC